MKEREKKKPKITRIKGPLRRRDLIICVAGPSVLRDNEDKRTIGSARCWNMLEVHHRAQARVWRVPACLGCGHASISGPPRE